MKKKKKNPNYLFHLLPVFSVVPCMLSSSIPCCCTTISKALIPPPLPHCCGHSPTLSQKPVAFSSSSRSLPQKPRTFIFLLSCRAQSIEGELMAEVNVMLIWGISQFGSIPLLRSVGFKILEVQLRSDRMLAELDTLRGALP